MNKNKSNNPQNLPGYSVQNLFAALGIRVSGPDASTKGRRSPDAPATAGTTADIGIGGRNSALTSMAGSMRARGMPRKAIEAALLVTNEEQCNPPLPGDEVVGIANSVSSYAAGSPNDIVRTLNDAGNAERFARQWGTDVRFVPELGKWLVWNRHYWQLDAVGAVMEKAKRTAFDIYAEGDTVNDSDVRTLIARHCRTSQQAPRLRSMLELAQTNPALVIRIAQLDADPWLLGVSNGTIDLRDGALLPARRGDYITKVTDVFFDAEAKCPVFLTFLRQIMKENEQLVAYLQRVFGYMLTGETREQSLFFLYGTGANGKSTLLNVGKALLGDGLCRQTPAETIMARPFKSGATPELACLVGARAVMTTEVEDGSFLAESLIKQLTGGDPLSVRPLYKEPFEYVPSFKLLIAGNHKPVIRNDDTGIWRRIQLIPFLVTIPPELRDKKLFEKLRAELPGILNWAVEGCLQWQKSGLDVPETILDAVFDYKAEMDIFGLWLEECCIVRNDLYTTAKEAYLSYRTWASNGGFHTWNTTKFGRKMAERFTKDRNAHGVVYQGLTLKDPFIRDAQVDGLRM